MFNTYRSAVALEAVDGGVLENVEIDSLQALNTGHAIFLRIGERVSGRKGRLENIRIKNLMAEIAANKPDSGYEYEGPVEDMPRNISPAIVIAGLPGYFINNVSFKNVIIKHPGGGNAFFAKQGATIFAQENLRAEMLNPPNGNRAPDAAGVPTVTYRYGSPGTPAVTIHMNDETVDFIPMTHVEAVYLPDSRIRMTADLAVINRRAAELFALTVEGARATRTGFSKH